MASREREKVREKRRKLQICKSQHAKNWIRSLRGLEEEGQAKLHRQQEKAAKYIGLLWRSLYTYTL